MFIFELDNEWGVLHSTAEIAAYPQRVYLYPGTNMQQNSFLAPRAGNFRVSKFSETAQFCYFWISSSDLIRIPDW